MRLLGILIITAIIIIAALGLLAATPADAAVRPPPAIMPPSEWEHASPTRKPPLKPLSTPAPTPSPVPLPAPAPASVITADVPILMYHHVGAPYRNQFNVPLKDFEAQMNYLAQNGYTTVSIAQIAAALRGQGSLPPCPVAITFDDGYANVYHNALPVLQKHGFRATFYVVTGYISATKAFMNWDQLRHLSSLGMEIGAHSYNHPYLTDTIGLTLTRQIVAPKVKLEAELGISITTFAYPYGAYNGYIANAVAGAGYSSAVAGGYNFHQSSQRLYSLRRTAVYGGDTLAVFISRLPKHGPTGTGVCPLLAGAAQTAPPVKSGKEAPP